jgi:Flp pilus assembly protein TadD
MLSILTETDAQTALSRLQEWIAAHPRDAAAHAALAKLWGKQGKWSEALPLLQHATSLEPHQGSYIFNLAVVYDQLHRYPEAITHYRLALQSGTAGLPIATIQARLAQLEEQK